MRVENDKTNYKKKEIEYLFVELWNLYIRRKIILKSVDRTE